MKQPSRTIFEALDPFMKAHGFEFIKSRNNFFRFRETGFDAFVWSTYPLKTGPKWKAGYHEGFYGLGMRSDAVEAICDVLDLIYGEDNKRYAGTCFRTVGGHFAFDSTRDRELFLRFDHLEEDVAEMAGRIAAMLEADGWAWYRRYADPVALSQGINDPIGGLDAHPLVNNPGNRPLVGVAAACVGEPERVPALVEQWLSAVRGRDEQFAGQRSPQADDYVRKFKLITDKARALGYAIPA